MMQKMRGDSDVKKGRKVFIALLVCIVIGAGIVFYDDAHLQGKEMWAVERYTDDTTVIRVEVENGTEKREYALNSEQKAALQELILESEFTKKQSMYIGLREEKYCIFIGILTRDTKREILCIESGEYLYCHIWGHGGSGFYKIENPHWEARLMEIIGLPQEERGAFALKEEL